MSKIVRNYYELRIVDRAWGTGYYARSVHSAIRKFLKDPLYKLVDGEYTIEVRGFPLFKVTKKTTIVTKQSIKIKNDK